MAKSSIRMVSKDRYTATAAQRRQYGGRTVTEFYATAPDGRTTVVTGYGKTPGERKTYARKIAEEKFGLTRNRRTAPAPRTARHKSPLRNVRVAVPDDLYPAEIDILRQLCQHRKRAIADPMGTPSVLRASDLRHPIGTSATVEQIVRGLERRGLVQRNAYGHITLLLSGAQMRSLGLGRSKGVRRGGARTPAERNFFDFSVPDHKLGELIPGGMSSGKSPRSFNQRQLRMGIKVELEHVCRPGRKPTKRDIRIATEIAMDHLTEDPHYYTKLRKAGL